MAHGSNRKMVKGFFNIGDGRASYKEIRKRVMAGSKLDGIHMLQLIAAMIIASIGLNLNSTEAIIGAMLICPLMGSVLAISYAVATAHGKLLKESAVGLLVQVMVCLATSTLYFVTSPISNITDALYANSNATLWDLAIAFVGGFAGALGISRKQEPSTLLSGVAVATALMPPLCAAGFGIAMRDPFAFMEGFYEFIVNVVFIAFGANIVLLLLHVPLFSDIDGDGIVTPDEEVIAVERSKMFRLQLIVGSLLLALPCAFFTSQLIQGSVPSDDVAFEAVDAYDTRMLSKELGITFPEVTDYRVGEQDSYNAKSDRLERRIVATVETKRALDEQKRNKIEELIRLHIEEIDSIEFEVKT